MGYVMQRDADKNGDVVETVKEEDWIKKHDEYMERMWEAGYQKCDLAYFDGENLVTLKNVRVEKDDNIYKTLEKDRFVFVLGDNQSLILNTSRIVYLDIKNHDIHWGLSECGKYVLR